MFCNTEGMFARGYCYDGARRGAIAITQAGCLRAGENSY